MGQRVLVKRAFWCFSVVLLAGLLVLPANLIAAKGGSLNSQGKWWDVVPEDEAEPPYDTAIPYSEIGPKLREIEKNSNRVKVDVIGQSAGGRNLFLVTLSDPQAMGRLGRYQAI